MREITLKTARRFLRRYGDSGFALVNSYRTRSKTVELCDYYRNGEYHYALAVVVDAPHGPELNMRTGEIN